jgi:hypothetical protein
MPEFESIGATEFTKMREGLRGTCLATDEDPTNSVSEYRIPTGSDAIVWVYIYSDSTCSNKVKEYPLNKVL